MNKYFVLFFFSYFVYQNSFQCPDFKSLDGSKCHYKGRAYNLGEELNRTVAPSCALGCQCINLEGPIASFTCASVDCPPPLFFEESIRAYEKENDCCPNYIRKYSFWISNS